MALLDLISNPSAFPIGRKGHSKNITFASNESPFHFKRVEWNLNDPEANPIFLVGSDHNKSGDIPDYIFRGGFDVNRDRRNIDKERITKFLQSNPKGEHFKIRQVALQALNPIGKIFNLGLNLLTQVGMSGLSNIRRSGAVPYQNDIGNLLNIDLLNSDTYLGKNKDLARETNYGLGDPGAPNDDFLTSIIGDNPISSLLNTDTGYNVSISKSRNKIDKVNYQGLFKVWEGNIVGREGSLDSQPTNLDDIKDFVKFRFEILDSDRPIESTHIAFRAFIDSYSDTLNANHNEIKYNGRGEKFYTYDSFDRNISINFKIAAQSRYEMKPLYQKLNYLMAQTAPNYSSTGRIRTPYMKLTLGDYFKRLPGVLKSVNINWQTDYPWEIRLDPEDKDKEQKVLPHVLDVAMQFQPIHKFVPNNSELAPFIGIDSTDTLEADWTPKIRETAFTTTLEPITLNALDTSVGDTELLPSLPPPPSSVLEGHTPNNNFDFVGSLPTGPGPVSTPQILGSEGFNGFFNF